MTEQLHFDGLGKIPDGISPTDLAWAAGLIDGEGCITITRQLDRRHGTIRHRMLIAINMTSEETIRHFKDIFHVGSSHVQTRTFPRRTVFRWTASSDQAAHILKLIRPYLITKREEADIAIEFQCSEKVFYMQGGTPQRLLDCRDKLMQRIKQHKTIGTGRKKTAKLHSS